MKNKAKIIKKLLAFIVLLSVLVFLAACGIHFFEKEAQPEAFGFLLDAMRFTLLTLTTIGYGDVYPITAGGKFLTAFVGVSGSLIGIAFFVAIVSGSLTLIKKIRIILTKTQVGQRRG